MNGLIWLYIIGGLFALLGVVTFVRWMVNGWAALLKTANDLIATLRDAAEIARAYREDLGVLRQIAQSGSLTPNFGDEPESIVPRPPPAEMPAPYWARYPVKPDEPEAPLEPVSAVDLTATDEEFIEQEKNSAAADYETQERQKAATREADAERLRNLTEQSGEAQ